MYYYISTSNLVFYIISLLLDVPKTGIIELDEQGQIINFLEKPQLIETDSRKSVSTNVFPIFLFN